MRVLDDASVPRILACQHLGLCNERLHRFLPTLLQGLVRACGDSVHRSAATASRAKSAAFWIEVEVCASSASSLSSLACAGVVVNKPGSALHLTDDRVKRTALSVCCGEQKYRKRVCGSPVSFSKSAAVSRDLPDTHLAGRGALLGLHRSSPSTSVAVEVRVLLRKQQAQSIRSRAAPRSGFPRRLGRNAVQARTGPAMPLRSLAPRS